MELFFHKHETYWLAHALSVVVPNREKPINVSTDLLLAFKNVRTGDQFWYLPEINLSEMYRWEWEKKVLAYCFAMPAYTKRFGTDVLQPFL